MSGAILTPVQLIIYFSGLLVPFLFIAIAYCCEDRSRRKGISLQERIGWFKRIGITICVAVLFNIQIMLFAYWREIYTRPNIMIMPPWVFGIILFLGHAFITSTLLGFFVADFYRWVYHKDEVISRLKNIQQAQEKG